MASIKRKGPDEFVEAPKQLLLVWPLSGYREVPVGAIVGLLLELPRIVPAFIRLILRCIL